MKKMKICMILDYYYPCVGGIERDFFNLAKNLVKLGHDVYVISLKVPNTNSYEEIDGIKIYRVYSPIKNRFIACFFMIPKILKIAKNCLFIHTSTYGSLIPSWICKNILRKKCIITIHEVFNDLWYFIYKSKIKAFIAKLFERFLLLFNFDLYIVHSNFTKNRLALFKPKEKIKLSCSGIDYNYFNRKKTKPKLARKELGLKNEKIFAYFGRPGPTKGLEYFINSFEEIASKIPNARFLLVLSSEPKEGYEYVKKLISESSVKDKIILHKSIPLFSEKGKACLRDYMAAADCIVVPSISEGFGIVAAEACALDVPVVASNTTSLPEVVSGKYLLVKPRDSHAIAEACIKVCKGEFKKSKKKLFTIEMRVKSHLSIYKDLLNC
ncbi:MAG: glycosyltransferase family 4 protein [Candidatus Aenigmatarchaeota archaeon]